jgi:dipeptidase D
MSQEIRNLEPKSALNKFADLNVVPRPSKRRSRFMKTLKALIRNFEDEIRNVIIRKPATAGMENRKAIVLQGRIWHQKIRTLYLILIHKESIC